MKEIIMNKQKQMLKVISIQDKIIKLKKENEYFKDEIRWKKSFIKDNKEEIEKLYIKWNKETSKLIC